eukprot:TRINITY_DN56763_c0_g1_i1.p1 TRINITY_DN56763_c0_g1~~TRINITY_DN56763_c0_g1_i1.p1  ORF type:complete len:340 (-),score=58.20 TRINITY_DN56763_c0_g1_i1:396-1415(-)
MALLAILAACLVLSVVCRLGFGKILGQVSFAILVVASLVPPWLMSIVGELYVQLAAADKKERRRQFLAKAVIVVTCICWRAALAVCFWIKVDLDGIAELRAKLGTTGRPFCMLGNHCSFFDIFLAVTLQPLRKVGDMKMIVSSHVLKMPIIGRVCKTMGHLAVPFKDTTETATSFEVDKEKLALVMQEFENHLISGGGCSWFPEGQVNKGDCSKMQQIRAGGLGIAVRNDVEVWCITFVGNAVSWPKAAPIGGYPARIGGRITCLSESSKALLSDPQVGNDERTRCVSLANMVQETMQTTIDEFVAKGFVAGNNGRKENTKGTQSHSTPGLGAPLLNTS